MEESRPIPARSLIEQGVVVRLYKSKEFIVLPLQLFVDMAGNESGSLAGYDPVIFLCTDYVAIHFLLHQENKVNRMTGLLPLDHAFLIPGIKELWSWRNLGKTWCDLEQEMSGRPSSSSKLN